MGAVHSFVASGPGVKISKTVLAGFKHICGVILSQVVYIYGAVVLYCSKATQ